MTSEKKMYIAAIIAIAAAFVAIAAAIVANIAHLLGA